MRITEAARRLGTSARMLRYRESLGLLPQTKAGRAGKPGRHRRFGEAELQAVSLALAIERRYGVGPAELAFALRALADPDVRTRVRELGERIGRISAPPTRALDFEKEKALRLLRARHGQDPAPRPDPRPYLTRAVAAERDQPVTGRGQRAADGREGPGPHPWEGPADA